MSLLDKLKERRERGRVREENRIRAADLAATMKEAFHQLCDSRSQLVGGDGLLRALEDSYIACHYEMQELVAADVPSDIKDLTASFSSFRLGRIEDRKKRGVDPFGKYDEQWQERGLTEEELNRLYEEYEQQLSQEERDKLTNELYGRVAPMESCVARSITDLSSFTVYPEGYIEGDAVIETQLHPKLVKYYRKYCTYATIADNAAWGYRLTEPPFTINLGGKSYKAMSLWEWIKRKAANCVVFRGGKIGPPPGQEGDVVCEILGLLTVASLTSDKELGSGCMGKVRAILEAYSRVLEEIDAVEDMRACIKEIQDELSLGSKA